MPLAPIQSGRRAAKQPADRFHASAAGACVARRRLLRGQAVPGAASAGPWVGRHRPGSSGTENWLLEFSLRDAAFGRTSCSEVGPAPRARRSARPAGPRRRGAGYGLSGLCRGLAARRPSSQENALAEDVTSHHQLRMPVDKPVNVWLDCDPGQSAPLCPARPSSPASSGGGLAVLRASVLALNERKINETRS